VLTGGTCGGSAATCTGFTVSTARGAWQTWGGTVSPLLDGREDRDYLFPISRSMNPNFKGVIYVDGDVVISGKLRGRITLAASGDIIIGDDVMYATDPGVGTCEDILGLFSGASIMIADNTLNAPAQATGTSTWYSFDDTRDEFVHGIVLALNIFTVEDYDSGARTAEPCGTTAWGRGCLFLTGGIIQKTRGAVWVDYSGSGGTGHLKRYAYDPCAAKEPPPYFPTTGHFIRGQHLPMDATGFEVGSYFDDFQT
jgi:hypothetical protein